MSDTSAKSLVRLEMNDISTSMVKWAARIDRATEIAYRHGGSRRLEHQTWVIDQMCRTLLGDEYEKWVRAAVSYPGDVWNVGVNPNNAQITKHVPAQPATQSEQQT